LFSNTPLAYMVDYYPRRSRLIFQVDVFPAHGRVPTNLAEVTERDSPYHRFDCNHTSELVVVHVGGQVVAETRRAIKLFETSIPPRYYIPIVDVTPGCLEPSTSPRTYCPYKGEAAYFNVHAGQTTVPDGAWTLPGPIGEALLTMGHVSFWGKGTEVFADGRLTPI
jgi:uncharacterized protein (DUF427 family)